LGEILAMAKTLLENPGFYWLHNQRWLSPGRSLNVLRIFTKGLGWKILAKVQAPFGNLDFHWLHYLRWL